MMETIGNRAYKEIVTRASENGITPRKEAAKLGLDGHSLSDWGKYSNPSAYYLQQMYYAGYDVIYILTGERRTSEIVEVETSFYDKEETYPDCTVQVLTNTATGDVSVGWWKNG